MGLIGGGFLRIFQTLLYVLAFCCSAIVLGIYSYFLAVLKDRQQSIGNNWRAVEGISGSAVLYTIFAVVLTCCLGGVSFFALLAIVLDIAFAGAFVALAILTRDGTTSCTGDNVKSPLGTGAANSGSGFSQSGTGGFGEGSSNSNVTYKTTYGTACKLNHAAFAVSVIGAFLFLILAAIQLLLARHHKKEKRFGPSPANNYTSGSGKRKFWQRRNKNTTLGAAGATAGAGIAADDAHHHHHEHHNSTHNNVRDAEMGAIRPSHDTAYTGSTMAGNNHTGLAKDAVPNHSTHSGYYTQPQGTGVNPYGYNETTGTHASGKVI